MIIFMLNNLNINLLMFGGMECSFFHVFSNLHIVLELGWLHPVFFFHFIADTRDNKALTRATKTMWMNPRFFHDTYLFIHTLIHIANSYNCHCLSFIHQLLFHNFFSNTACDRYISELIKFFKIYHLLIIFFSVCFFRLFYLLVHPRPPSCS